MAKSKKSAQEEQMAWVAGWGWQDEDGMTMLLLSINISIIFILLRKT